PICRAFPRVGIPPTYRSFDEYSSRVGFMVDSGAIEDYTYLWYDVRPHPNFGTVEIRVMDAQTRLEHTLALAALVQAMVKELCEHYDSGQELSKYPYEMLDENKWLAARHGLDGELVDLPSRDRVSTKELARRVIDRVRPHSQECGSEVSMYVTECPYCGQRVRKRAPKLERGAEPDAVPRRRRRPPSLPRLRRDEIPGIAPETKPYATIVLIVAALGTTLAWVGGLTIFDLGAIVGPIGNDWWRLPAYAFVHTNAGSLFATLVATGLFGMHLERRFGSGVMLAIFLLGATAGGALTVA